MRLITISISHFCEKARWALDRARIQFVEDARPPLLSWAASWRAGGGDTVPVLVTGEAVLADSTDILRWVDARASLGLYPADNPQVAELEELFDETLGPHVRRWAYSYVLEDRRLTRHLLTAGTTRAATWTYTALQPAITFLMRKGMNITPAGAERSRLKVEEVFARVEALLADGRPFLAGDRFTAADLTFAALAAPAIGVDGYGPDRPDVPKLDVLPPALRAAMSAFRDRPAGQHVLRMYREERRSTAPATAGSEAQGRGRAGAHLDVHPQRGHRIG